MKGVTKYEDTLRAHNFAAVCGLLYRETLEVLVQVTYKLQLQIECSTPNCAEISVLSCNIADTVLTFVVLSSDVTGVQRIPRVNLYVTLCSIHPNKSSVSLLLDSAVYCSVSLGSKGCEPFGSSQMVETVRHNCSLNILCCHKCDSYMFRIDFY